MLLQSKQKGFSILAVILVIVAVIVAIGVWAMSGQTNTSQNSSSKNDILAAAIVQDGAMYRLQYDKYNIEGLNLSYLSFVPNQVNSPTVVNLLDPTVGAEFKQVNKSSIRDGATVPEGMWVLSIYLEGVNFADSSSLVVAGIKDDVCKSINNIINGKAVLPPLGATLSSAKDIVNGATVANPVIDGFGYVGIDPANYPTLNLKEGCVKVGSSADQNVYFTTLKRY